MQLNRSAISKDGNMGIISVGDIRCEFGEAVRIP